MKVLVTGASGFIGSNASRYFKSKGFGVIGVDSRPLPSALDSIYDRYAQIVLPDENLEILLGREEPDYCLHCAGGSSVGFSVEHPEEDFESQAPVTYGLLNALRLRAPGCKTIIVSSAAVYGNPSGLPIKEDSELKPISPYGYHKLLSESICRQFNLLYQLKTCSVRLFSAYGSGLKKQLLWDIYQKARSSQALELHGTGNETRDFIHVTDIVRAFEVIFAQSDFEANIYNLAGGVETSVKEVAELMLGSMDMNLPLLFKRDVRAGDPQNWRADIKRIQRLGYEPSVTLVAGVDQYVGWCKNEQS